MAPENILLEVSLQVTPRSFHVFAQLHTSTNDRAKYQLPTT